MKKTKMAKTKMDESIAELADQTDHRILAAWAADCAERVLPCFEDKYPLDMRPRTAVEAIRTWVCTGIFKMSEVRHTSLAAHAAARDVAADDAARSAARAAGQAMAAAHIPHHAIAAAIYAATAVRDAAAPSQAEAVTLREREWQHRHLLRLISTLKLP